VQAVDTFGSRDWGPRVSVPVIGIRLNDGTGARDQQWGKLKEEEVRRGSLSVTAVQRVHDQECFVAFCGGIEALAFLTKVRLTRTRRTYAQGEVCKNGAPS